VQIVDDAGGDALNVSDIVVRTSGVFSASDRYVFTKESGIYGHDGYRLFRVTYQLPQWRMLDSSSLPSRMAYKLLKYLIISLQNFFGACPGRHKAQTGLARSDAAAPAA
jgi:hypothetical protein